MRGGAQQRGVGRVELAFASLVFTNCILLFSPLRFFPVGWRITMSRLRLAGTKRHGHQQQSGVAGGQRADTTERAATDQGVLQVDKVGSSTDPMATDVTANLAAFSALMAVSLLWLDPSQQAFRDRRPFSNVSNNTNCVWCYDY